MKNNLIIYACALVLFVASSCNRHQQPQTVTGVAPEETTAKLSNLTRTIDDGKPIALEHLKNLNYYVSGEINAVIDLTDHVPSSLTGNYIVKNTENPTTIKIKKGTTGIWVDGADGINTIFLDFGGECSKCYFTFYLSNGLYYPKLNNKGNLVYGDYGYKLTEESRAVFLQIGYKEINTRVPKLIVLPGKKVGVQDETSPDEGVPEGTVSLNSYNNSNSNPSGGSTVEGTNSNTNTQDFALNSSSVVPSANSISVTVPFYSSATTAYRLVVYEGSSSTVVYSSKDILPSEITSPRTVSNSKIVSKGTYSVAVYAMNGSQTLKVTDKFSVTLP